MVDETNFDKCSPRIKLRMYFSSTSSLSSCRPMSHFLHFIGLIIFGKKKTENVCFIIMKFPLYHCKMQIHKYCPQPCPPKRHAEFQRFEIIFRWIWHLAKYWLVFCKQLVGKRFVSSSPLATGDHTECVGLVLRSPWLNGIRGHDGKWL